MDNKISNKIIAYLSIFIGWLIFVYPSIFGAVWGLLDDPTNLLIAHNVFNNVFSWIPNSLSGRYVPFYFFNYGICYLIFGDSPKGFYIWQSLIVLTTLILIYQIVYSLLKKPILGILSVLLFLTSSAVAECFFTLGKNEVLLLLLQFLIIYIFIKYINIYLNRSQKILLVLALILLMLLSIWQKETGVVICIFGFTGSFISYILYRNKKVNKTILKSYVIFSLLSIISIFIARLPIYVFQTVGNKGTYITYQITFKLLISNLHFYIFNQPDVFLLGIISTIIVLVAWKKSDIYKNNNILIVNTSLLAMAWSYIIGILFWRWPLGYYIYIPSGIFSISTSLGFIHIIDFEKLSLNRLNRYAYLVIITLVISRMYSLPYSYYVAVAQRSTDQILSESIMQYANIASNGEKLNVEQWPFYSEQVTQSNILLQNIMGYKKLTVAGIQDITNSENISPEILKLYNVSQLSDINPRIPNEGDYILTYTGYFPAYWVVRGVSPFKNESSFMQEMGWDLEPIASKIICNKVLYFKKFRPIIENVYIDYKLYRVKEKGALWEGRYSDDWIGNEAKLTMYPKEGEKQMTLKITSYSICIPNRLRIYSSGELVKDISLNKIGDSLITLKLNNTNVNPVDFEFKVDKTFIPKQLGINDDTRSLSVQISMVQ